MGELDVCRICLDSVGPFISPCSGCRGSAAYVHFECAKAFYMSARQWHNLTCPTCKTNYDGETAVKLGKIGLAELRRCYGERHSLIAIMLVNLGNAYGLRGDAARKRDRLELALQIQTEVYDRDNAQMAVTLTNLGNAYGDLGNALRKCELLERAVSIQQCVHGSDNIHVALSLDNLGNAYGSVGKVSQKLDILFRF